MIILQKILTILIKKKVQKRFLNNKLKCKDKLINKSIKNTDYLKRKDLKNRILILIKMNQINIRMLIQKFKRFDLIKMNEIFKEIQTTIDI